MDVILPWGVGKIVNAGVQLFQIGLGLDIGSENIFLNDLVGFPRYVKILFTGYETK
jgi:hypothetical protein